MMQSVINAVLTLCVTAGNTALLSGVLYGFGYARRTARLPFRLELTALLLLQAAFPVLIRDTETLELVSELCLLGGAMTLPYLCFAPRKKRTFAVCGLMLCAMFDYLAFLVLSLLPMQTYRTKLIVYAVLYSVSAAAVWIVLRKARIRLLPDFPEQIPSVLCAVIFCAAFFAYYASVLPPDFPAVWSVVLRIGSAALFFGSIVYIASRYASLAVRQREDAMRYTLETKRYEELIEKNRDVRAFRHDYRNNLFALHTLLQDGRTQEAAAYVHALSDTIEQTRSRYHTGNLLSDAILTDKAQRAEPLGVTVLFDGSIPETGVANRDLCTILANALDNAVEGSAPCAPCTVTVHAVQKPGGLTLRIENPVPQKVEIRGGRIRTRKENTNAHGFGLDNIRKTAKLYDGYADVSCDDTTFTLEVGLLLKGEKTE